MARKTGASKVGERAGRNRNLYLDDETVEAARTLGNGSVSEGIRLAVSQCRLIVSHAQ